MIYLKIGGSLITDKKVPFSVRWDRIVQVVNEVAEINEKMIIGHGGGSFGHVIARDYEGLLVGFPKIREAMMKLNMILVSSLLAREINAVTFPPSTFMVARGGKVEGIFVDSIMEALDKDMVPLVHGDAILDRDLNYVIFSTERVFRELAQYIKPRKVLIASTDPVWIDGKMVDEINDGNYAEIVDRVGGSEGIDVTGGMRGKIKEAALLSAIAKVDVYIFDAREKGRIKEAARKGCGTRIRIRNRKVVI